MSAYTFILSIVLLTMNYVAVLPFAEAATPLGGINPRGDVVGFGGGLFERENQAVGPDGIGLAPAVLPRGQEHTVTVTVTSCETSPPTVVIPPVPVTTPGGPPATSVTPEVVIPPVPSSGGPPGPPESSSGGVPPPATSPETSEVPPGESTVPPATETTAPSTTVTGTLVTDSLPPGSTGSTTTDTVPADSTSSLPNITPATTGTGLTTSSSVATTTGQPPAPNSATSKVKHSVTAMMAGVVFVAAAIAVV